MRQWWIADTAMEFCNTCGGATDKPGIDRIHVVEYAYYKKLESALEKIADLYLDETKSQADCVEIARKALDKDTYE